MTIEQADAIDMIGTDKTTGAVHLTISDHLEWNSEHLFKLQEKLNAYLAFAESGELLSAHPDAEARTIVFDLVLKHRPDDEAALFLERVGALIEQAGFAFHYGPLTAGYTHDNG